MKQNILLFFALLAAALFGGVSAEAAAPALPPREASIVTISALGAQGDLPRLRQAMADGLEPWRTASNGASRSMKRKSSCSSSTRTPDFPAA